ncbi:tetratricopeptide repeat protein [Streptomyces sp. NPDC060334]|uniref:tetratricopeptide repeat protein n=1 Tax=Streptomyces sp. NPDC060334 TaxID=3347099 RepID=UPI0036564254
MSRDKKDAPVSRRRVLQRPQAAPGPLRDLKDLLYEVYLAAQPLNLDEIAADITGDDALDGAPGRDTVHRCLSSSDIPANQADVVAIATVLARRATWDVDDLVKRARDLWVSARMARRVGKTIGEFTAFDLEVHQSIEIEPKTDGPPPPVLPLYVPRNHDRRLRQIVDEAKAGKNRLAVLVGESSTGKTRACWEAVRELPAEWRLWHPLTPTRPEAALADLASVGRHTMVWLNEAQRYLLTPDGLGEHVAAGLRELLRDPDRGPVLVLGTVSPWDWATLTTPCRPGTPDPHREARDLLVGSAIEVPASFVGSDLEALHADADRDPRLAHAVRHAEQGHITQYLAGAPALLERYRTAPPAAKALINAAMDAQRLGHGPGLSLSLLETAAEGYLTDTQWDLLDQDWRKEALQYTGESLRGARGPLTLIRPRSGQAASPQPEYRLADYLDQHARGERRYEVPPAHFWEAAARHASAPAGAMALADAARSRWRLRHAALLYRVAADLGEARALVHLGGLHERAGSPSAAANYYQAAANAGDARGLIELSHMRERAGEADEALRLLRAAAVQAAVNANPLEADYFVALLARPLMKSGDTGAAERLSLSLADAGSDDPWLWAQLTQLRMDAGDWDGAESYARQAVCGPKGDFNPMMKLVQAWRSAGDGTKANLLYEELITTSHTETLWELASTEGWGVSADRLYEIIDEREGDAPLAWAVRAFRLEAAGDIAGAETLHQACADARFRGALGCLARLRMATGDWEGAEQFALRALGEDGENMAAHDLAMTYRAAGRVDRMRALYQGIADDGHVLGFSGLAQLIEEDGDNAGAERVALKATSAGHSEVLFMLQRRNHDARWRQLLRYGLEPDGSTSAPWTTPG